MRQSSVGGQANEAGSLYRAGVAAYLAAHGLAGAAVEAAGYVEGGPYPVSMTLESGDAVDDIRCKLPRRKPDAGLVGGHLRRSVRVRISSYFRTL